MLGRSTQRPHDTFLECCSRNSYAEAYKVVWQAHGNANAILRLCFHLSTAIETDCCFYDIHCADIAIDSNLTLQICFQKSHAFGADLPVHVSLCSMDTYIFALDVTALTFSQITAAICYNFARCNSLFSTKALPLKV